MTLFKKSICIILSVVMLLSIFAITPITAGALKLNEITVPAPKGLKFDYYNKSSDLYFFKWNKVTFPSYEPHNSFAYDAGYGYYLSYSTDKEIWHYENVGALNYGEISLKKGIKYYIAVKAWMAEGNYDTSISTDYVSGDFSNIITLVANGANTGKKNNPMTVKTSAKSLKAKSLKKAKKTVKPLTIKNAKGTVKIVKVKSGTSSKIYSKIIIAKKNGAITFKKGKYKKGTYKVKLQITAAGNKSYKKGSKTVTVKIKIK